jgi:hypothetical protein
MNGANLMDMISDEAMLEQIPSLAKYSRKMLDNLTDVNSLLKHATKNPSSSKNSNSSRSESPNGISSASAALLRSLTPNPTASGTIEVAK